MRRVLARKLSESWFRVLHKSNLVYNTCWEDPRLDREALNIRDDDVVLTITSAGCNALDYLLEGPRGVCAVDVNPKQNALLELKCAAIRNLDYEQFFQLFGEGAISGWRSLYRDCLRPDLSPSAQQIWDRSGRMFSGRGVRKSFYFHGSSGTFAWLVNQYIDRVARMRGVVDQLLSASTVEEQAELFERHRLHETLWTPLVRWLLRRDAVLAMLGVPRDQRLQLEHRYEGGIARFVADRIEAVFTRIPLSDNYFWRVYLTGCYTPECCPEYLKRESFDRLRDGLVDRLTIHTATLADFLKEHQGAISRFVLLDHMDWLSQHRREALQLEWQRLVERAAPDTRIIWRSAAMEVDYVDPIEVTIRGCRLPIGSLLEYDRGAAARLHAVDRVHTYGSFYIAQLRA